MVLDCLQKVSSSQTSKSNLLRTFLLLLPVAVFTAACTPKSTISHPSLSGYFTGKTAAHRTVAIQLDSRRHSVTGFGELEGQAFSLAGQTSVHAPISIQFDNGRVYDSHLTLAADNETAILQLPTENVVVHRSGSGSEMEPGPFSGKYLSTNGPLIRATLFQSDDLIAGIAIFNDMLVAITGRLTASNQGKGTVFFTDQSSNSLRFSLSHDLQTLTVYGLGGPLQMRRQ